MLSSMIPTAPPRQPGCVDLKKKVREFIFEIIYMIFGSCGIGPNGCALQSRKFLVDQLQVC